MLYYSTRNKRLTVTVIYIYFTNNMPSNKTEEIVTYLTEKDKEKARELSEFFGRSLSDLVRWLINEKWKDLKK